MRFENQGPEAAAQTRSTIRFRSYDQIHIARDIPGLPKIGYVQNTEPVQKRAKGSREPRICENCKYFCVGGGEHESKVHVRTAGRGSSGIIPAKDCPLLKDLCPYNQNPWAYLSKMQKAGKRRIGLNMLTYNAEIARANAGM